MASEAFDLEAAWAAAAGELDREVAAAQKLLAEQKLTVCLAGALGSGRPALLAALHGRAGAQAGPPEEPEDLVVWSPPDRPEIRFALPPPIQDVSPERRAQVERFVREEADLLVFAFNANAGLTRPDLDALAAFRATGKAFVVVFTRLETLRSQDRRVVLDDARNRLGLTDGPPIGVSAATGEGVAELAERLGGLLETRGKAILLDRWRAAREGEIARLLDAALSEATHGDSPDFAQAMACCVRASVRMACLAGREARLDRFREVLREALAAPRNREFAAAPVGAAAAAAERRELLEAFAYAVLHTARCLFLEDPEPGAERLRASFQGRLIERRLVRALGVQEGAALDPVRAFDVLATALRSGELAPARLAALLPGVKAEFQAWRAGRIDEDRFAARVGALVRGEGVADEAPRATGVGAALAMPEPPEPEGGVRARLGQWAGRKLEGVAGDLVEALWETRVKPRLAQWLEEQKALISVDLLKLRAELEADIDRKHGELLRRTRQEAEDFMTRTVATIGAQAEEAERRAKQRLWISSLFILGWAVVGLLYALMRRWLGG